MWFGPNFLNLKVTFPGPKGSTWALKEKISENADILSQETCEEFEMIPEVRGVFVCSKIEGYGPSEAIIKVIMQIPWGGTEMQSSEKRRLQRGDSESIEIEAEALKKLTRAKCSATPVLLGCRVVKQTEDMWVPGGYLGFVAMTRLPGTTVLQMDRLSSTEAEQMRQSFKESWMRVECYNAGVAPIDAGLRNLLWDSKHKKW
ncbi:hypothetical protein FQN54_008428 [Arachnomyces sp. PD_36]|nr:hypothetical protein FQN54_008428 [Arachnomyces sp. PD_36]